MIPIVVLQEPQNVINIAVVMRAMLNFGVRDIRLVAPAEFDARRIEGIAHKSGALIERAQIVESLDDAVGDCTEVFGLTARGRAAKRNVARPREAAEEIAGLGSEHRVALLFGREDKGLTNEELDRCHRVVTIPTTDEHPSLNLAQAATVMLYECFVATADPPFKRPRYDAPPATRAEIEQVFTDAETALDAIEFFKTPQTKASILRTLRELVHRMHPDQREAKLARAMCREVVNYLDRKGVRTP